MSSLIKEHLSKGYPIKITEQLLKQLILIVNTYELRGDNPLALNTPLLYVHRIVFTPKDQDILFELFDKDRKELTQIINSITSINKKFKVASNPFNILVMWLIHNIWTAKVNEKLKYQACTSLYCYWQYKFFSSILINLYAHKANEDIMAAVINDLSLKSDITKYGTWKNLMYARAEKFFSTESKHYDILSKFQPDAGILYAITDTQTKIRNQIVTINIMFHQYKDNANTLKTYQISANVDGERVIKSKTFIFDNIANNIFSQMIYGDGSNFINDRYLMVISRYFPNMSHSMIRTFLTKISEIARDQKNIDTESKILTIRGEKVIVGIKLLIEEILEFTYLYLIDRGMNINNKLLIIQTTKRIYSYSRPINDHIQRIKRSIFYLLDSIKLTNRAAYISSLGIILPMYIIIKSFDYVGKK